ncbi:MAG: SDR family NAD(P)-dependent oxidoreductase [Ferruginibacter sp.]
MKTVIITGASGNMGTALVNKYLSAGYNVIGTVIPNDPVALDINNNRFEKVTVDLLSEEDSAKFIDMVVEKYKTIDVVITTVGGFATGSVATTKTSDINKQYRLNFETAFNVVRPAFIQMIQQGNGKIFLVGSKPGLDTSYAKGMVAYSLGKSLIFRLAELMNEEAKGTNVITSVVVPGTIDTPSNRRSMPDADFSKWIKPGAIADTVCFYCTDTASVIREPVIKLYNNS